MPSCGLKCSWSFSGSTCHSNRAVSSNILSVTSSARPLHCCFKHVLTYGSAIRCPTYSSGRPGWGAIPRSLPEPSVQDDQEDNVDQLPNGVTSVLEEVIPGVDSAILSACLVGLLTGITVVLFNATVHAIRDLTWDGVAYRGASFLREEPLEVKWARVILVPASGGLVVGILNTLRSGLEGPWDGTLMSSIRSSLEPVLKAVAACVTLGTGNSLGPEGPSVEIGSSVGRGVATLFDKGGQRRLSLRAAGSAAGISSGFNAAVAGCFFAVESVLWPSPPETSLSLTNTTSMVILSAVIASVVTEIGLGSQPAFAVPDYDFRSPSELPLYLLLGILCGLVSATLTKSTSFMMESVTDVQKTLTLPKGAYPVLGGLVVGLLALVYPEILYWGFENVDILLESRPFVKGLSAELLVQLVAVKIFATSLCRASGLVGGYYAPSLFIGAATGMAYGKIVGLVISQSNPILHLSIFEVASPQAYGLVGMAATLAGVCQVPLTAVLLLFELTQDYRIVLPLLGAVGMSSWITSGLARRRGTNNVEQLKDENASEVSDNLPSSATPTKVSKDTDLCELENSLCLYDPDYDLTSLAKKIVASQAMRTKYVSVLMSTSLTEAVSLMLAEKQSCVIIVNDESILIGLLTLEDIQLFSRSSMFKIRRPEDISISEVCGSDGTNCLISFTASPDTSLYSAQNVMERYGLSHLPVTLESRPVGLLDRECISLACRLLFLTDPVAGIYSN